MQPTVKSNPSEDVSDPAISVETDNLIAADPSIDLTSTRLLQPTDISDQAKKVTTAVYSGPKTRATTKRLRNTRQDEKDRSSRPS